MRELVISSIAKEDIEHISDFLQKKYSNNSRLDFLLKLTQKLQLIENMPLMYPASKSNTRVRKCLINNKCSLYYEVTENLICILSVIDNRTSPDNIRF